MNPRKRLENDRKIALKLKLTKLGLRATPEPWLSHSLLIHYFEIVEIKAVVAGVEADLG